MNNIVSRSHKKDLLDMNEHVTSSLQTVIMFLIMHSIFS